MPWEWPWFCISTCGQNHAPKCPAGHGNSLGLRATDYSHIPHRDKDLHERPRPTPKKHWICWGCWVAGQCSGGGGPRTPSRAPHATCGPDRSPWDAGSGRHARVSQHGRPMHCGCSPCKCVRNEAGSVSNGGPRLGSTPRDLWTGTAPVSHEAPRDTEAHPVASSHSRGTPVQTFCILNLSHVNVLLHKEKAAFQ